MPMTIVVTRNAPDRFRGFLASCMCEIAPGVYTAPRMTAGVRRRVWSVMEDWFRPGPDVSVLMTWPNKAAAGGQAVQALGIPRQDLCDYEGIFLARRPLSPDDRKKLESRQGGEAPPAPGPSDAA